MGAVIAVETTFPILRSFVFGFCTSFVFCDGAVYPYASQPRNFFSCSENSSNLAANCLVENISIEEMSREGLKFLQSSEEEHEATDSDERIRTLVKRKGEGFRESRVKEVAKIGKKGAKIGIKSI